MKDPIALGVSSSTRDIIERVIVMVMVVDTQREANQQVDSDINQEGYQ